MAITNQACAACKYQRRKCAPDCPLAPYFPPDQLKQFLNVHKLFGVSNVVRILKLVEPDKRGDAIKSIVYEADQRERDPVHGCLGVVKMLEAQVSRLDRELTQARDQVCILAMHYRQQQQQSASLLAQQQASFASAAAAAGQGVQHAGVHHPGLVMNRGTSAPRLAYPAQQSVVGMSNSWGQYVDPAGAAFFLQHQDRGLRHGYEESQQQSLSSISTFMPDPKPAGASVTSLDDSFTSRAMNDPYIESRPPGHRLTDQRSLR